jgi:hypothetical protein
MSRAKQVETLEDRGLQRGRALVGARYTQGRGCVAFSVIAEKSGTGTVCFLYGLHCSSCTRFRKKIRRLSVMVDWFFRTSGTEQLSLCYLDRRIVPQSSSRIPLLQ